MGVAVTLRDVAERAGVSPRTVSNVVNDFPHVSPAMRVRVQAALDELGYRPNLLARSLRKGTTGIIALLVPQIAVPYFGELAHEIVERASELGITVLIDETGGDSVRELELLGVAARSSWVDGVILSSLGLGGSALASLGATVPVVLLGERTAGTALDHVGIDNVRASMEAVQHLLDSGRTRIAAIGGSGTEWDATSRLRLDGYRAALVAAGLPVDDALHARTPHYTRADAAVAVRKLLALAEPPDALFCFSDELAAGSLRELHVGGIRVPHDVSVVGFDDIEEAGYTTPALTTVSPDRPGIARAALDLLLERIGGSEVRARDVRVPARLVVRESSMPVQTTAG